MRAAFRRWGLVVCGACGAVAACAVGGSGGGGGPDAAEPGDAFTQPDASSGADAAKPDAATCTAPLIHCAGTEAGACADLTSDPEHCGNCGTACTTADAGGLEAGSGNPDSGIPAPDGGTDGGTGPYWSLGTASCKSSACATSCPTSMMLCSDGLCYDTQNFHDHCGACATACAPSEYCAGGHCCAPGTEYCNGSCLDVLSDKNNCGGCGATCGSGMTCSGGKCTSCSNANVALTATATTSGGGVTTYGPQIANDNVLESASCTSFNWITAGNTPGTAWIQYTWTSAQTLKSMHMDTQSATVTDSCGNLGRTLGAATVQWWNGSSWVTDGTVSGKLDDWDYTFTSQITTTQVRLYAIYCTNTLGQQSNPIVYEWQVFGCN